MGERTVGNWMGGVLFDDEVSHGVELTGREKETIADVLQSLRSIKVQHTADARYPHFALGSGYLIYPRVILLNRLAMDKNPKAICNCPRFNKRIDPRVGRRMEMTRTLS